MAFQKGKSGNPKGRKPGVPNKSTAEVREVFKGVFDRLAPKVEGWIEQAAEDDPAKGADLSLRLAEYFVPKLGRQELVGQDGGAVQVIVQKIGDDK